MVRGAGDIRLGRGGLANEALGDVAVLNLNGELAGGGGVLSALERRLG